MHDRSVIIFDLQIVYEIAVIRKHRLAAFLNVVPNYVDVYVAILSILFVKQSKQVANLVQQYSLQETIGTQFYHLTSTGLAHKATATWKEAN